MRILGIDPGIGRTGWGIVSVEKGKLEVENYGCLETKSKSPVDERLLVIFEAMKKIIVTENPDALAIEDLFFNTNAKTAFAVGQARGIIILAAAEKKIPVVSYTPLQVKMALTGYGRAEKTQVGQMVKTVLKLTAVPKPDDTTDALAIALTHAFSYKMKK